MKKPELLFFLFLYLLFSCNKPENNEQAVKLLSADWHFKKLNDTLWYSAKVPGTVHTDLFDNNLIPNPFYADNEKKLQWIENEDWEYKTSFTADENLLLNKHIELVFQGLDTYASVFLNQTLILKADNMFRTWRIDVKKYLKKGKNSLRIVFYSPMKLNIPKVDSLPYHLPAGNDRHEKKVSVFTRKAPYHFGWDWGPRFVTFGIWRPIMIEAWDIGKITDFQIFRQNVSKKSAILKAEITYQSTENNHYTLKLYNGNELIKKRNLDVREGKNFISQTFEIKNPELWWTNGLGKAHLYDFTIKIEQNGKLIDEKTLRYGIRTLEVVQKPDSLGKSFYFKLNGVPVFMKGANYIPQDNFLPRVDSGRYRKLISSVKAVGMNMLRVWGGGIYENDIFYDLCDENGILIWQDFMFACSMYPGDSAFLNNVKHEAEDNIRRLRNHPSIALWCGNNEMQIAWERWGYMRAFGYSKQDSAKIYEDYLKLFDKLLPSVINGLDSGRFYWQSSPNSAPGGWKEEARSGDIHYWGVWWGKKPFSAYIKYTGRFVSEYGFQSLPAMATLKSFAPDSSLYLVSPILKAHNKHPIGFETIDEYMRRDYRVPADFNNYVFVSQLLQAEGMKTAIEAHRRAMPYCMGTLYWQLNDCWPVASWSSIDYYGRWKAFHYYLKKLYAPVLVSPVYENDRLSVYLISDLLQDKNVKVTISLMDFYGAILWQKEIDAKMKADASQNVFTENIAGILKKYDKNKIFLQVSVSENDKTLSNNNLFFAKIKDLVLPHAQIITNTLQEGNRFEIRMVSDVFVKNVFIDYPDDQGCFSDNYFDLLPGEVKTVWFNVKNPEEEIKKVHVKSLIDRFNVPNARK